MGTSLPVQLISEQTFLLVPTSRRKPWWNPNPEEWLYVWSKASPVRYPMPVWVSGLSLNRLLLRISFVHCSLGFGGGEFLFIYGKRGVVECDKYFWKFFWDHSRISSATKKTNEFICRTRRLVAKSPQNSPIFTPKIHPYHHEKIPDWHPNCPILQQSPPHHAPTDSRSHSAEYGQIPILLKRRYLLWLKRIRISLI